LAHVLEASGEGGEWGVVVDHRRLAQLCYDVYKHGPEIRNIRIIEWMTAADPDSNATVIVLRGTDSLTDIIADLMAVKVAHPWGKVVAGALHSWNTVRQQIAKIPPPWILTGHSLGAEIAMLAAAEHPEKVKEVVVFGAPRLGNHAFANKYNEVLGGRTIRYSNGPDLITVIPMGLTLCPPGIRGFKHCGRLMFWNGANWREGASFWGMVKLCLASRWRLILLHSIHAYGKLPYPEHLPMPTREELSQTLTDETQEYPLP
jgi:pimeloyl-ACP methyl ester carboxylesterase